MPGQEIVFYSSCSSNTDLTEDEHETYMELVYKALKSAYPTADVTVQHTHSSRSYVRASDHDEDTIMFIAQEVWEAGEFWAEEQQWIDAGEAWSYTGYWNVVFGEQRCMERVIEEFELTEKGIAGLDEWIGQAEAIAWSASGEEGDVPKEWFLFHQMTLREITKALERVVTND